MSVEADIAELKADVRNVVGRIERMGNYMERSDLWREDAGKCLAILVKAQEGVDAYQKRCDEDRAAQAKTLTDQDKRITECEGFQKRLIKTAAVMTGIGSLSSPWLSKIWERIFA